MTVTHADPVARFTTAWQHCLRAARDSPPRLADYVPDGTVVRAGVLADLVRIDLRHRWGGRGPAKRIADYRAEFPEVDASPELVDLVCEEFLARRGRGPLPLEEFLAEYPELAEAVRDRLTGDHGHAGVVRVDRDLTELAPGQRVDDFDLRTELGRGRNGRVFLARQLSMQRVVAVRVAVAGGADPQPMVQLDHPHIVRVFDERVLTSGGEIGSLVYMQYLPGGTAAELLRRRRAAGEGAGGALLLGALDAATEAKGEIRPADSLVRAEIATLSWPETVAWIGRRLADALGYADRHGIAHHAIDPANVLFTSEGIPKLADFAPGDGTSTPPDSPTALRDWLAYRSPEQLAAALDPDAPAPDTRSDLYALGVLLWELLTGTRPFTEDPPTVAEALRERRAGVPAAALATLPADCPPALRRVLLTCLDPDPGRRWPNGTVLAEQLDLCLDPRARDLVDPPERSWRVRLRPWRVVLISLAIAVPNILASIYNIDHNNMLMHSRQSEQTQRQFEIYSVIVNGFGFAFGTVALVYLARYLITVPHGLAAGVRYDEGVLRKARASAVRLGDWAALIIFSLWLVSGLVYPLALRGTSDVVSPSDYAHFVVLHTVSGVVALTYPFLLTNFYIVRCVYPMFLGQGGIEPSEAAELRALRRRSGLYLVLAASIPLIAVAGSTLLPPPDLAKIIVTLRIMCIASIVAFVVVYLMFRAMEQDLDALRRRAG
ncbi:serine/threonine protein kinase [Nocardia bhagyanarayanae]|uniref:Serine/threonine protein kinase n=1 Tax=Nocardia bhagyanarayanae TaxID=1215925 RepID=A0A543F5V9_9NOCA|nr:protein kinase [Nocardia bhagyanarayanae]TQM29191.1 serine/threonine protein kinase [Nocardia bhagyanarayanae]